MKTIAIITAALLSAGAVSAQFVTPGHAQMAASLGLDAAQYSLAELAVITEARRANEDGTESFYLAGANRDSRGGVGEVSLGKSQMAASLGVNAADFSLAELVQLQQARSDNDPLAEAFILSGQNRESRGANGAVSRGKAQIAATLGLNPAEYSLHELVAIAADQGGGSD
jgi:hypothetical protein